MKEMKSAYECYMIAHSEESYWGIEPDKNDLLAMETYAAQFKNEWVSVQNGLPEENDVVLVFTKLSAITTAFMNNGLFHTHPNVGIVTHWQPLPSPPSFDK